MTEEGRKRFLKSWQEKKKETLTHPYLGEKLSWGFEEPLPPLLGHKNRPAFHLLEVPRLDHTGVDEGQHQAVGSPGE